MSQKKQGRETNMFIPLPLCVINNQGKITDANEHMGDVFIYDAIVGADFFNSFCGGFAANPDRFAEIVDCCIFGF